MNAKDILLLVCDKPYHKIKDNLPHWEELENVWNFALILSMYKNKREGFRYVSHNTLLSCGDEMIKDKMEYILSKENV